MKISQLFLLIFVISANHFFASCPKKPIKPSENIQCEPKYGQGWSVDIGGQYTWMALSTPPTYSGSTGGVSGTLQGLDLIIFGITTQHMVRSPPSN